MAKTKEAEGKAEGKEAEAGKAEAAAEEDSDSEEEEEEDLTWDDSARWKSELRAATEGFLCNKWWRDLSHDQRCLMARLGWTRDSYDILDWNVIHLAGRVEWDDGDMTRALKSYGYDLDPTA